MVTLRATVEPSGVTGTVEFFVDGTSVGFGDLQQRHRRGDAQLRDHACRPAAYDLRADFTSTDATYGDSTDTLDDGLTVTLEESTTTYTGPTVIANGGPVTLTALFEEDGANDDDGDSAAWASRWPAGPSTSRSAPACTAQTCDGVTNAFGIASCTINPVNQPLGPGVVSAAFTSDGVLREFSRTPRPRWSSRSRRSAASRSAI